MSGYCNSSSDSVAARRAVVLMSAAFVAIFFTDGSDAQQSPQQQQAQPWIDQAMVHVEASQWDQAIEDANKAIQLDPESSGGRVALGMALNGNGEFDNAITEFDWVTSQTGRDSETVDHRANAYAHRSSSLYHKREYLEAINSAYTRSGSTS